MMAKVTQITLVLAVTALLASGLPASPVTQILDGQIQAPPGVPVNIIPDGQPQAQLPSAIPKAHLVVTSSATPTPTRSVTKKSSRIPGGSTPTQTSTGPE
ncbi:uncharacterized protein BDZ99DRAFT_165764 [Mytilinidion resinicola]|uniref:Uncharacterized protein n=1 Tax=Mytilinidion resinicola TaxID=574789 RepID=A0A6A6Y4C2_9PEZI|nr:uncharacterized protein BDZ99DRAFT_165764 [Mytilinidion resinicola]KAF2803500.1 hypothetical protein BDZ99DRAFT_165764 [Mytilinidion resinicola]